MYKLCEVSMLWLHVARWPAETYWHFNKVLHPGTWLSKRSTVSGSTSPSWHELGQHISWGSLSWREQGGDTKERRSAEDSERKRRHWSVSWGIGNKMKTRALQTARETSEGRQLSGRCCYCMMSFSAGGNSRSVIMPFIAQFTPEEYQTEGGWWWWVTTLLWDRGKRF